MVDGRVISAGRTSEDVVVSGMSGVGVNVLGVIEGVGVDWPGAGAKSSWVRADSVRRVDGQVSSWLAGVGGDNRR